MLALLRRRVSLRLIKLHLSSNKFADYEKGILSFFYKRIKKIVVLFLIKKGVGYWGEVFSLKVWFNWVLKEPIF
jgi:hypothetical protein